MSELAIKVENVSKLYRLGDVGTGTLGDDLTRFWAKLRGKEDPFSQIATANDRSQKADSNYVWSLRDINFEIKKGDAVGIIGRNGAGKSTLLKILSRITSPTTGGIKINGRVASLLEVGTGFNPDLTGRQNIYMNGAILGMTRREITLKLEEIVEFSGVSGYIDTPVKRYSSGMYVRLAFAVAAHLDPEILIVDEVLAVGDAEFQKKCLGKMQDVNSREGRTVLFVSHNMGAINELCSTGILLKKGGVEAFGKIHEVVSKYLSVPPSIASRTDLINDSKSRRGNGEVRFTSIIINNGDQFLDPEKEVRIRIKAIVNQDVDHACFNMLVRSPVNSEPITSAGIKVLSGSDLRKGNTIEFDFIIPSGVFRTGLFPAYFWLGKRSEFAEDNYAYDVIDAVYNFNFSSTKSKAELGYNSLNPTGFFNFNSELTNIRVT